MSLRRILLFISICLGITTVAVSSLLIVFTTRIRGAAERVGGVVESVHVSEQIQHHLFNFNRELFLAHLNRTPGHLRSANREVYLLEAQLKEGRKHVTSVEERAIIDDLEASVVEFISQANSTEEQSATDLYLLRMDALKEALEQAGRLTELNLAESRTVLQKTADADELANVLGTGTGVIAIVAIAMLWIGLRRWVYRPVAELSQSISGFSKGEEVRAPETGLVEFASIGKRFNDLADRLNEQHRTQLQFLASVAHDLRNPLGAIQMACEVLLENDVGRGDRTEMVGVVRRQAIHLERLVGDLLDSTRIEAGHLELRESPTDLVTLVNDAVNLHQSLSSIHKIRVTGNDKSIICNCDKARVSQVLNNLLSNAIKYSPNGGSIEVRIKNELKKAIVEVEDQGIGISADDLPHIFEPFRRTRLTKLSIPGVGLGLSVTKKIIERHGGNMDVESSVGKGTVFRFELPKEEAIPRKAQDQPPLWQ